MPGSPSLSSARLAVVDCVRRGDQTVNAIAAALGITDNAVRIQIASLERDALIQRRGLRRSGVAGQPAAEYELTPKGEVALSSAYAPALTALVATLGETLEPRAARAIFLDAGRRLAESLPSQATGNIRARADACAALIGSLGGSLEVKTTGGRTMLEGKGCPLAGAVRCEPRTCTMVEALLARHARVRVEQRCEHGENPRCRFEVGEAD